MKLLVVSILFIFTNPMAGKKMNGVIHPSEDKVGTSPFSRHSLRLNILDMLMPQVLLRYEYAFSASNHFGISLGYQFRNSFVSRMVEPNHKYILGAYETPIIKVSYLRYLLDFPTLRSVSFELGYKDVSFDTRRFYDMCTNAHEPEVYYVDIANHSVRYSFSLSITRQLAAGRIYFFDFSIGAGVAYEQGYYTVVNEPDPYGLCSHASQNGIFQRERLYPTLQIGFFVGATLDN